MKNLSGMSDFSKSKYLLKQLVEGTVYVNNLKKQGKLTSKTLDNFLTLVAEPFKEVCQKLNAEHHRVIRKSRYLFWLVCTEDTKARISVDHESCFI